MKQLMDETEIAKRIYFIRGCKVMLDEDLAALYDVEVKNLNLAVKRNTERFPEDFKFQLTYQEVANLRLQFATSSLGLKMDPQGQYGGRRYLPYVFTEQGVAMLSSVLRSRRAIQVNIQIMRAFTQLRQLLMSHQELAQKLKELEKKYDAQFKVVFDALRNLLTIPEKPKRSIGFIRPEK